MTLKQRVHRLALDTGATTDRDHDRIEAAFRAEREQCAKIAETCGIEGDHWRRDIAAAIRGDRPHRKRALYR